MLREEQRLEVTDMIFYTVKFADVSEERIASIFKVEN
jgi:hypothetical protein